MPHAETTQAETATNDATGADDKPTALSAKEIADIVNSAITSHAKRQEKAYDAKLEALTKQLAEAAKPKDEPADKPAKKSPELAAMEQQLAEMRAALKAEQDEKIATRKAAREDKAFSDVVASLTGKVKPGTEVMVAKLLKADGRIVVDDETGQATLRVRSALAKGLPEEDRDLPIADGVASYLKTKDAALFLAAPNSGGPGPDAKPSAKPQLPSSSPAAPPANFDEALTRTMDDFARMGIDPGVLNSLGG